MLRSGILLAAALCVVRTDCNPPVRADLAAFPYEAQEQSYLCWAACGSMCMAFHGRPVTQVEQASYEAHGNVAFHVPPSFCLLCNIPAWPDFEHFGFHPEHISGGSALSWEDLKEEVACAKSPIAFTWVFPDGSSHMMVARGYETSANQNWVKVNDPKVLSTSPSASSPPQQNIVFYLYDEYAARAGFDHTHGDYFYSFN